MKIVLENVPFCLLFMLLCFLFSFSPFYNCCCCYIVVPEAGDVDGAVLLDISLPDVVHDEAGHEVMVVTSTLKGDLLSLDLTTPNTESVILLFGSVTFL